MNNTLSKIYILDAVRGVAAMIVALYHFIHFSNHHGSLFDEKAPILKTVDPFLHGSICVFFIISGYVIFLHLERNGYRIQNWIFCLQHNEIFGPRPIWDPGPSGRGTLHPGPGTRVRGTRTRGPGPGDSGTRGPRDPDPLTRAAGGGQGGVIHIALLATNTVARTQTGVEIPQTGVQTFRKMLRRLVTGLWFLLPGAR